MLSIAILDANHRLGEDESFVEIVSVVGQWLLYEIERAGLRPVDPRNADIVLLDHAGGLDWRDDCMRALRAHRINPNPEARASPYVIAGGAVDTAPLTALSLADGLAVGEAYRFVRELLRLIGESASITDVRHFVIDYPHAIAREQIIDLERESVPPYRFIYAPPILASPDDYVDWSNAPAPTSDDGVTRILTAKGCWLRCQFCATSYRQTYRIHDAPEQLLAQIQTRKSRGERISLITNDAAALPFLDAITQMGMLQFQSMTIKALRDASVLETVLSSRMKIIRLGVEGISERIRRAFGKYISDDELLAMLRAMRKAGQQVHLFFIVGAPYETESDWDQFGALLRQIVGGRDKYWCRIKCTAFNPQAPAPLAYFIPDNHYWPRWEKLRARIFPRMTTNVVKLIGPRHPQKRNRALAEMLALDARQTRKLMLAMEQNDGVIDMASAIEEAQRMPWEIVQWPLTTSRRWRLSRSYQKMMSPAR